MARRRRRGREGREEGRVARGREVVRRLCVQPWAQPREMAGNISSTSASSLSPWPAATRQNFWAGLSWRLFRKPHLEGGAGSSRGGAGTEAEEQRGAALGQRRSSEGWL